MKNSSIYTAEQNKRLVQVILFLLGIFLVYTSLQIITSLLSAIILYILFKPLFLFLTAKKNLGRSFSTLIVLSLSFLVIVLPLLGLSYLIFNKLIGFQNNPQVLTDLIDKIQHIGGTRFDMSATLKNSVNDISKWAIGTFSGVISGTLKIFISLIIIYFTLFYMFRNYEDFEKGLLKYMPFDNTNSLQFAKALKKMTYSNLLGQGLIGICQGIIVAIGFLIFGIPDPMFWGVVSIFVCFLPVVGAPIIFVPAGIIELASHNTFAGVGILIWGGVLVTLVDNFLRQFISKKIADTHPLITIVGVIIGVPVFGLIGLVMGPFLISFFILLFKMYENTYLKHPSEKIE